MSQPVSRYLHPFDIDHHPSLEPEVRRAIFAAWASDRSEAQKQHGLRRLPEPGRAVDSDRVFDGKKPFEKGSRPTRPQ